MSAMYSRGAFRGWGQIRSLHLAGATGEIENLNSFEI